MKRRKRNEMERSSLPYLAAAGVLILFRIFFAYFGYKKAVKRYKKRFRKALIGNGMPRKMAVELSENIAAFDLKELINGVGRRIRVF